MATYTIDANWVGKEIKLFLFLACISPFYYSHSNCILVMEEFGCLFIDVFVQL